MGSPTTPPPNTSPCPKTKNQALIVPMHGHSMKIKGELEVVGSMEGGSWEPMNEVEGLARACHPNKGLESQSLGQVPF